MNSAALASLWQRGWRIAAILTHFFVGQGALQGINIVIGLYLVRVLSVESYAQFGLTLSFQQTVSLLMDLGFASTIIPLVGSRSEDRSLVGAYIRAARNLRDRTFWILAPVTTIIFIAIMRHHHWSWYVQMILIVSVFVSIYFGGKMSYYAAPLFLYGKLKEYYLPQTVVGVGRLASSLLLNVVGALNGWSSAVLSGIGITINSSLLKRECHRHIEWPEAGDPQKDKEVLRYIMPAIPAMVFSAFQLQSSIFLISIFGQTSGIAQVAALGRLAALFGVLNVFNAIVVEPSMARLPREKVVSRYFTLLFIAILICTPVVIVSFVFPGPVLWLLGSQYAELRPVVGWAMFTGSLNFIATLLWVMNRSRKWVFWSGTIVEIVLTLLLQVLFIVFRGVRTTHDAIMFGFVGILGPVFAHLYVMVVGMSSGNEERHEEIASTV